MDPATITFLASSAVHVLAPYLRDAGREAIKSAGSEAGKKALASALGEAKKLYEIVANKVGIGDMSGGTLRSLEATPDDKTLQLSLESELNSAMKSDESFSRTIADQLVRVANTRANTEFVNNVAGDVGKLVQIGTVIGNVNL